MIGVMNRPTWTTNGTDDADVAVADVAAPASQSPKPSAVASTSGTISGSSSMLGDGVTP